MFTGIAMKIARTELKLKKNLGFRASWPSFNPAKHFYPPLFSAACEQFSKGRKGKSQGSEAFIVYPFSFLVWRLAF